MTTTTSFSQCLHISALHARIQYALDDELGTYHGLSYADYLLLRALEQSGDTPMAMADLVPCLGVPLSAVVRQILPLEKTGLVQRQGADGAPGRRTVRLRPAARQVLVNATETAQAVCRGLVLPDPGCGLAASAAA
ncbi:MarR family transcriptional regulator [Comamonadaceae bacterium G21597-S1]|nr:MarR family transcriptional regulator [Comamonadaceae bacterium G21597-S1]